MPALQLASVPELWFTRAEGLASALFLQFTNSLFFINPLFACWVVSSMCIHTTYCLSSILSEETCLAVPSLYAINKMFCLLGVRCTGVASLGTYWSTILINLYSLYSFSDNSSFLHVYQFFSLQFRSSCLISVQKMSTAVGLSIQCAIVTGARVQHLLLQLAELLATLKCVTELSTAHPGYTGKLLGMHSQRQQCCLSCSSTIATLSHI